MLIVIRHVFMREKYFYYFRQQRDSNPRGRSPSDFESDALTTRPCCPCIFVVESENCNANIAKWLMHLFRKQKVASSNLAVGLFFKFFIFFIFLIFILFYFISPKDKNEKQENVCFFVYIYYKFFCLYNKTHIYIFYFLKYFNK